MKSEIDVAKFQSLSTFADPSFWSAISRLKINEWKLDDTPKPLVAFMQFNGNALDNHLSLDYHSCEPTESEDISESIGTHVRGKLLLSNTKNAFDSIDRRHVIESAAKMIWEKIVLKDALTDIGSLNTFYLTAYADVKNYVFYYWNCIPALIYPDNISHSECLPVHRILYESALNEMATNGNKPFFMTSAGIYMQLSSLSNDSDLEGSDDLTLVFLNPSSHSFQLGWTIRNILAAIAFTRPNWHSIRLLALKKSFEQSFITKLCWDHANLENNTTPKCVGWERSFDGILNYRSVNLKSIFDPIKIMEQSVDLNLRLMRWQQAPSIDIERFLQLKVLMIGSGTLGTNIARALLGWGVRNFVFLDCGVVSYNNPLRQSLFEFEDCKPGDKSKALTAAEALKRIYPSISSSGVHMKIPMPGHPYSKNDYEEVTSNCSKIDSLIKDCDVVFLVMDSRESRWLPTLISSVHNKLAITVALGFDSYVIIRHGINDPSASPITDDSLFPSLVPGSELGCYFCSDVTAPGDSMKDRTLDQQCTISRSGISMIASGMAAELLASVLQHDLGPMAPARLAEVDENSSPLGATPHQIRGFVSRFHQMTPTVRRFDKCIACSPKVRELYNTLGFEFLNKVFQDPTELERVTGLSELQLQADNFAIDMLDVTDSEQSEC